MKTGIIYRVTSPNGKVYIGQTIQNLEKRKHQHFHDVKRSNAKFNQAIKKYKKEELVWEIILEKIPAEHLNELEIFLIYVHDSCNSGYNSTFGGDTTPMSAESRQKSSKTHLRLYKEHPEIKELISKKTKEAMKRPEVIKKHTEAINRRYLSGGKSSFFGKHHTEESKNKLAETKIKSSYKIHNPDGLVEITKNLRKYCREKNLHSGAMYGISTGKVKYYKGYRVEKLNGQ